MGIDPSTGIEEVSRTWTRLGREDPMWAVLTDREKAGGGWTPAEFLATGATEIATLLGRLAELGADPARGRAVDFGCGAGRLSHGLATAGFAEVIGLDISPTMLEKAREIVDAPACDFRLATGPELDVVEPASADLVYTCRVLQHMPTELAHRYVRAFYRIVRPGGYVVFQMPTAPARNAARARPARAAGPARPAAAAWHGDARHAGGRGPRPGGRVRGGDAGRRRGHQRRSALGLAPLRHPRRPGLNGT